MSILTLENQSAVEMGTKCFIITQKFASNIANTFREFEPLQFAILAFLIA
jgi:hypothetical protein